MTTDSLHDYVHLERMIVVLDSSKSLPVNVDLLVNEAINSGSEDNIYVVLGKMDQV